MVSINFRTAKSKAKKKEVEAERREEKGLK